ncbi:MAG: hypothetical protein ACXVEY_11655 [Actinomycetota bacterium]
MSAPLESKREGGGADRDRNVARTVLTRWAIAWETRLSPRDIASDARLTHGTLVRLAAYARRKYLQDCPSLQREIREGLLRLRTTGVRGAGSHGNFVAGEVVGVAASITELRPSSFELALRISGLSRGDPPVANVRCSVSLTDPTTGTARIISDAIRQEIIAREREASLYS